MPAPIKDSRGCGFVVTELGRSAAASVETCQCTYGVVATYLVCRYCQSCAANLAETREIRMSSYPKPN